MVSKQQSDKGAFKELCVGYVLNILEQDDREHFERMLDDATDVQQELYQRMRSKANELLFEDIENLDPEELKKQLLAEVDESETEANKEDTELVKSTDADMDDVEAMEEEKSHISYAVVTSIALGIICLSLIFYSFSMRSAKNNLEDEIAQQEEQISHLNSALGELEQMLSILGSRQLHVVQLLGMEANPFGFGNVLWDAQNLRALVRVSELSTPPADMQYHLWTITDNEAVLLQRFSVDSEGKARFFVEEITTLSNQSKFSFAITLEPEDGSKSDQPSGEMYLMGSFGE